MNSSNLTARTSALRTAVMARKGSFVSGSNPRTASVALWRAAKQKQISAVQLRSEFLYNLVEIAKVEIPELWTIAGEHLCESYGGHILWGGPGASEESQELYRQLGLCDQEIAVIDSELSALWKYWRGDGQLFADLGRRKDTTGMGGWGSLVTDNETVYWSFGWIENHSIRDYAKVIRIGYAGLADEISASLGGLKITDPQYIEKENFLIAALRVCDAGILLGKRYAECARELAAKTSCAADRLRLENMAAVCSHVPERGARTLAEAVQSLWFAHILTCGEDGINANSIGRIDQILYPYYQADKLAGRITPESARELMQELACKFYLEYDVQAMTLGGCDADGNDAVNELSYIILEATGDVGFVRDLSVRIGKNTPAEFVEKSSELIVRGGGIPFIFNDECFIKALTDRGIALVDARNYAPIGCVELTIPGKANPHAVSGWFSSTKCLELAMNNGVCWQKNTQLGPQTGKLSEFKSFEEFYQAYLKQVEFFAERMVYNINWSELAQREKGPLPCWSLLTDDCIKRGKDITNGGAVYNYHSICFLGAANTADSLWAIKHMLFDTNKIGADELLAALHANFDGHENLRNRLLCEVEKYGNDNAGVDKLAARVCDDFINLMDTMRSALGGRFFVHLFSFLCNLDFGRTLGATPDGRRAAEPLAYSLSAHQGRDKQGVTAMLSTLSHMPHSKAAGGSAAIIELDPAVVEGPAGVQIMNNLILSALKIGVGQLQWNVVTEARLRKAKEDPENYGNLAVRVAGFSQMFKLLNPDLQDHIIARTKHRG